MSMVDFRDIRAGLPIPRELYCDQPYLVKADDGAWVCVITTAQGSEGAAGEHIGITRSGDRGRTWTALQFLEPDGSPESSYAVLLKTPFGRIYCFYNYNKDNIRSIVSSEGLHHRVDMQGYFVFRYSDDNGISWSARHDVPIRETRIDRYNPYGGTLRLFWTVGKPFYAGRAACIPIHKIGDMLTESEGWMLRCDNLAGERDSNCLVWETLPDGEDGLRAPSGGRLIAEEQSMVCLSDGSLYCVYRTIDGHPAMSCSRDGGHTWNEPQYMRYDSGRLMKHPRAANFVWKCENGNYLYWYHNNGGKWYSDRNPAWVCGGVEIDSPRGRVIRWSEPELLLYDVDPNTLISYPDLLEDGGGYYVTETQKLDARIHPIPPSFLNLLWRQFELTETTRRDLLGEAAATEAGKIAFPRLPVLGEKNNESLSHGTKSLNQGFTLEFLVGKGAGGMLLDSRSDDGQGIRVKAEGGIVSIELNDGRCINNWSCDEPLNPAESHHIAIIVDGAARIVSFVTDGRFNDGGETKQFGFGRLSPFFTDANGAETAALGPAVKMLRVYGAALMTTEIIGNWRAMTAGGESR